MFADKLTNHERLCIAHVVPIWLPLTESFVLNQIEYSHHDCTVLAGNIIKASQLPVTDVRELTPLQSLPFRMARRTWARMRGFPRTIDARIARAMETDPFDVIHAHHGQAGVWALAARRRSNIPLVTSFYGRDQRHDPEYASLFQEGDHFLCLGPTMAERLVSMGCPAEKISLIPLSIQIARFSFSPRSMRSPIVIASVGRLVPKKGFDLALRAFARVRVELGPCQLWIVGDGPLRDELEDLSRSLDIEDAVSFLGSVQPPNIPSVLERVDVALQPSRVAPDGDREGAPTVLLEFQALGIPVVTTDHADIASTVVCPEVLVEEEDEEGLATALLQTVHMDVNEKTDLLYAARANIEKVHTTEEIAGRLDAIYQLLTSHRPRGAGRLQGEAQRGFASI